MAPDLIMNAHFNTTEIHKSTSEDAKTSAADFSNLLSRSSRSYYLPL